MWVQRSTQFCHGLTEPANKHHTAAHSGPHSGMGKKIERIKQKKNSFVEIQTD